ncbi:hypothetical protein QQX98_002474 [Neonectria punicea]|uniref:NAD-dependent epimerase/dehydratase domain-containing protein n=1 Tax=Neonectria punicea TaxID=979145 RepID=A0ABR1HIA1_9HYPO
MKVLILGGAGVIGGHAAIHLQSKGHEVTIAGRQRPDSVPVLAALPFLKGDYVHDDITTEQLTGFDAVVFTAGADARHVPVGEDVDKYVIHANGVAVPAFAKRARSAGVKHFVHIGSAYPHVIPDLAERNTYVRSRVLAGEGVAKLSTPTFFACSLDPPFVVGIVPGMKVSMFEAYVKYAEGKLGLPESAPMGGFNFISEQSLSEAIEGALENGPAVAGRTILVGDENLTYAAYFEKFFRAVRKTNVTIQARDEEHPLLPRGALFGGDRVLSYEPDPEDVKILGNYRRKDIDNAVEDCVKEYHVVG